MEVNDTARHPLLLRDYLDQYNKRSYALIVGISVSVALVTCTLLTFFHFVAMFSYDFWGAFIITACVLSVTNSALFWSLTRPFRALVQTVVMISGAPTTKTPPNPNQQQYADDGFKEILQTLYELASANNPIVTVQSSDDTLQKGLDQTPTGVVILDSNLSIVYSNNKAPIRITQDNKKQLNVLFPGTNTVEKWVSDCQENAVHAENTWVRIADKPPGDNSRKIYDVVGSYQKGSNAETVLTFFDRTDQYAPEEDELDFISFAAHELRGPITVIRGYLDVIDEELSPLLQKDQAELMQRLIVSANRLSSYVNNILNASRFDRRHFKVHLTEEQLDSVYDSINDDMQMRATSQNRILSIDIPKSLPTVAADKNSVGEVLSNLIDNAIKYSNEGGHITVKARPISRFVEVSVIDRGIGMPASVLPNLFHKFYRSHRSRETVAGTGIGLYISKAIVESHGGTMEVRSLESEGSTFTFTLPIYSTVADKIKASDNSNKLLIEHGGGWIRNHSMYRG